jgi:hypothetical protein
VIVVADACGRRHVEEEVPWGGTEARIQGFPRQRKRVAAMAGGGCNGPSWIARSVAAATCLILVGCFGDLQDHLLLYF